MKVWKEDARAERVIAHLLKVAHNLHAADLLQQYDMTSTIVAHAVTPGTPNAKAAHSQLAALDMAYSIQCDLLREGESQ